MSRKAGSQQSLEREKLLYFVMLRQIEASSPSLHDAYQRLADAASEAVGWDPRTVVLDWLEGELRALRQRGPPEDSEGPQLMKAAVALSNTLKQ